MALERQAVLAKPAGSLGVLERLPVELAALQATATPRAVTVPFILFAGDHGVTAQGVSAFPSAVTVEMLKNFAAGGAAISVLAQELGCRLTVIDAGTLSPAPVAGVTQDKVRAGTRDFTHARALTAEEVAEAFEVGRRSVETKVDGADVVIFGEMGIGNTTSAAAVASALLGCDPREIAGGGTGLDQTGIARKIEVISRGLSVHELAGGGGPVRDVLGAVGGIEICALVGAILTAAQRGVPVLVDGFIVSVAALAAVRLNPSCRPWLIFSHLSAEPGHARVLAALEADPILDLGLRLGEGSGAATALAVVRLACSLHNRMATFKDAGISGPD
jgi:nicotinate-nucleotide--dimethylbenzimidazole phosphoribosyltransferase